MKIYEENGRTIYETEFEGDVIQNQVADVIRISHFGVFVQCNSFHEIEFNLPDRPIPDGKQPRVQFNAQLTG